MRAKRWLLALGMGWGLMASCSDPDIVPPGGEAGDGNSGAGEGPAGGADVGSSGAAGTQQGSTAGTESSGGAAGTESSGGAAGTESSGGAAGTESSGGAAGTESSGGAAGTESSAGASGAGGASQSVVWIGACTPLGLSADGETVLAAEGLWTAADGWQALPDLPGGALANAPSILSADGKVVFGNSGSALGNEAYRWSATGGIVGLGVTYPPLATSHDGSVMAGLLEEEGELLPFRWTQGGGVQSLDSNHVYTAESSSLISAQLTADGKTAFFSFGEYPAMWTEADGLDVCEGDPCAVGDTEFGYQDQVTAINDAGTVLALFGPDDMGPSPTGTCLFDTDPDEDACEASDPCGCSWVAIFDYDATGNSAVGIEFAESFPTSDIPELYTAFYWSKGGGMRALDDVLPGSEIRTYPGTNTNDDLESWHPVHPYLTADGSTVLAQDIYGNCFLAPLSP